jgi:hypothetical protein
LRTTGGKHRCPELANFVGSQAQSAKRMAFERLKFSLCAMRFRTTDG